MIRENLCWALGYNACAIPIAALGLVPPWAAALGMSLSSLLVVGNSLRLNMRGRVRGLVHTAAPAARTGSPPSTTRGTARIDRRRAA